MSLVKPFDSKGLMLCGHIGLWQTLLKMIINTIESYNCIGVLVPQLVDPQHLDGEGNTDYEGIQFKEHIVSLALMWMLFSCC